MDDNGAGGCSRSKKITTGDTVSFNYSSKFRHWALCETEALQANLTSNTEPVEVLCLPEILS